MHAACSCEPCSTWAVHRATAVALDDFTLCEATDLHHETICTPLKAELATLQLLRALQRDMENAQQEIACLRVNLEGANDEIFRQCDQLEGVKDNADHTIVRLHNEVSDLEDTVRELEHGHTPCRQKLPHCSSCTPSRSYTHRDSHSPSHLHSHHASSRTSRPDSPVMMDCDVSLLRSTAPPPYLLTRLSAGPTAAMSTSSLPLANSS